MKKLIFTVALASLAVAASAQVEKKYDQRQGTYEVTNKRGPYQTGRFFDNMFIDVAGGVNIYNGKDRDTDADFGDRLAPAIDISIGKWLTPSVGLRVQGTGIQAKGSSDVFTPYTSTSPNSDGKFNKKFDMWGVRGDVLWNISNAIGGYKETRTWDLIPFAGFGGYWSKKKGCSEFEFAPAAGLINNFRLGGVVDINLEARYMIVRTSFDKIGTNRWDGMASVTAGLSFKLGPKQGFKRPAPVVVPDYTPYQNRINALENDLNDANAKARGLAKDLEDCLNRPQAKAAAGDVPSTMQVFFNIGSAVVTPRDMVNIENIANVIKSTPDKKYTVTGYADSATGSAKRNQALSKMRAEAVAKALTDKFGVKSSQISIDYKGGIKKHNDSSLDRAAVIK